MHPNASEKVRMGPHRSEHGQQLPTKFRTNRKNHYFFAKKSLKLRLIGETNGPNDDFLAKNLSK